MTLYTLDIKKVKKVYLIVSIICLIFSFIYEFFSHSVYSIYMISPGFILLLLGYILVPIINKRFSRVAFNMYNSALAVSLTGCYLKGILDIFGTTNDLLVVYFIFSVIFLILTIFFLIRGNKNE